MPWPFAAAGYRPELAWTRCDYAETVKERDSEGDRANDMYLLDESLAIPSELGMRALWSWCCLGGRY